MKAKVLKHKTKQSLLLIIRNINKPYVKGLDDFDLVNVTVNYENR